MGHKCVLGAIVNCIVLTTICFALHCEEFFPSFISRHTCDSKEQVIVLKEGEPFYRQIAKKSGRYIIKYEFDLEGKSILLPKGCTLVFQGGLLRNGRLRGEYTIEADAYKILDEVDVSSFSTHPFLFKWLTGEDNEIAESVLKKLPPVSILFGDDMYYAYQPIDLSRLDYIDYDGLNLSFSQPIKAYCITVAGGLGNPNSLVFKHICEYVSPNRIKVSEVLPIGLDGYLISIKTADKTMFDSRPGGTYGLPALYKGITTTIESVSKSMVELADSIGPFPRTRLYDRLINTLKVDSAVVYSTWAIRKPKHVVFKNCSFISTEKNASVSISGKDVLIENCRFTSLKGAEAVLSVSNSCGALIKKCIVEGAWSGGNDNTNYGIQINSSTRVTIDSCSFFNNRRGVDFSGAFETRYSTVSNSYFKNEIILEKTGSAAGGHSTSYGNQYSNNIIEGRFQIGIQCRGEKEIIDGNLFNAYCNGAIISTSFDTIVKNNCSPKSTWGLSPNALFIGNNYGFHSVVTIEDNEFEIGEKFIYHFNSKYTFFSIKGNRISFLTPKNNSSVQFATDSFSGVSKGNIVTTYPYHVGVLNAPE